MGDQQSILIDIRETLTEVRQQVKLTNGRVTKLERNMLIAGTAIAVTILLKFPELAQFIKLL